jgi:homoserine kinase type II
MAAEKSTPFESKITRDVLEAVAGAWGLSLRRPRPDIDIAGSPERCAFRVVLEDMDGRLYIAERLSPESVPHKRRIAETLALLRDRRVPSLEAYLPDLKRDFIASLPHGEWQIIPYVEGKDLERPDYVFDDWRGRAMADFLCSLRDASRDIPGFPPEAPFSLPSFIQDFLGTLEQHDPDILRRVEPVFARLQADFFPAHDELPVAFCHGDYHPLNVVWSEKGIAAVIDWEFLGTKRGLYDAANLIGCIGMELPRGLTGGLVLSFLKRLYQEGFIARHEEEFLFDFVLALRFAWLSEWLHKSDREMVDLECVYISLLHENREILQRSWGP